MINDSMFGALICLEAVTRMIRVAGECANIPDEVFDDVNENIRKMDEEGVAGTVKWDAIQKIHHETNKKIIRLARKLKIVITDSIKETKEYKARIKSGGTVKKFMDRN